MLPDISTLLRQTDARLEEQRPQARRLVQIYALVCAVAVIAVNLLSYYLMETSSGMTGLYKSDARNSLMVLNIGVTLVMELALLLWWAGYSGAALELSRGGSPEWKQMLWALYQPHRFLLCGLILLVRWFVLSYLLTFLALLVIPASMIFQGDAISPAFVYGMSGLMVAVLACLVFNRRLLFFRMADGQERPSLLIYRESMALLRGHRRWFLRIDLHFWWYYLAQAALLLLPYLTWLLPESYAAWFTVVDLSLLFLGAAATFVLNLTCRNRIWVTYALAYDALLQQQRSPDEGSAGERRLNDS